MMTLQPALGLVRPAKNDYRGNGLFTTVLDFTWGMFSGRGVT